VPLPDPKIPGFCFPEKEDTILDWVKNDNKKAIYLHGWGLWVALTTVSDQVFEGQKLRVFETWYNPDNLLEAQFRKLRLADLSRNPRLLHTLSQLSQQSLQAAAAGGSAFDKGSIKYDPVAAKHIQDNNLLSAQNLKALQTAGQKAVPNFDNSAISLKPHWITLSVSALVDGRYFMLPVWPGPPDPPVAFGPIGPPNFTNATSPWKQWIWIDTKESGAGTGTGDVDKVGKPDGSSRTPATTYGVGRFINFRNSATEARFTNALRAAQGDRTAFTIEGDYVILVAMHVTSREITRWTWQTFWWSPNADLPVAPSCQAIVDARPAELKDAPRNYLQSSGYSMVFPDQPNTGGSNVGESVYAYNPWLEAGFGPDKLPASKPGTFNNKPVANNFGVQTNCMSCHAQARYPIRPKPPASEELYTGDQYIDLNGQQFNNGLKLDFLWSLAVRAQ
jgi:hypothetical protein